MPARREMWLIELSIKEGAPPEVAAIVPIVEESGKLVAHLPVTVATACTFTLKDSAGIVIYEECTGPALEPDLSACETITIDTSKD